MWTSPPTAQGKRGLDRPLLNLSQPRPGTKLSVAAAPADGRVTTSSSTPPEPREDWEHGVDLYVARQPILDRSRRTYASELLFRDGLVNAFNAEDPDLATARVIDASFFVLGIETLTGGRKAFVNFTRRPCWAATRAPCPAISSWSRSLRTCPPTPTSSKPAGR
jgi:Predicted signal transduction protein containing EAL and modified HD-GYP domains